ncbi:MAG TPA: CpaF family protein, partial [Alphaproteobacteria bacterium]|nr:CpaF family protein [Alphaproteobacteria bacterium]
MVKQPPVEEETEADIDTASAATEAAAESETLTAPKAPEAPVKGSKPLEKMEPKSSGQEHAPVLKANPRMDRARKRIWTDLRDGIDLKSLARMDAEAARTEILSAVQEIGQFRGLDVTPAELAQIAKEAADDMLGFGPLEELLEMDGIADIMINGPKTIYIEMGGKIERAKIEFRDNQHLLTICQRI